ncbi:MAG: protease inhibitor I42 family protein [Methanobacterium sp.]|uniref:protease inhibitor I42 family protein n=1 Tax=Methanobacterium sp. TaxID=2164 RepID=UPI003C734192
MKIKLAGIFTAFICLAMVTGAFAATPDNAIIKHTTKTIKLESNPSTGYHWVATYNKALVKLVNQKYEAYNPKLLGSPGIDTFIFTGYKGSKVVMKYVRTGDVNPLKIITFTL